MLIKTYCQSQHLKVRSDAKLCHTYLQLVSSTIPLHSTPNKSYLGITRKKVPFKLKIKAMQVFSDESMHCFKKCNLLENQLCPSNRLIERQKQKMYEILLQIAIAPIRVTINYCCETFRFQQCKSAICVVQCSSKENLSHQYVD